jgi:hypothetical protein
MRTAILTLAAGGNFGLYANQQVSAPAWLTEETRIEFERHGPLHDELPEIDMRGIQQIVGCARYDSGGHAQHRDSIQKSPSAWRHAALPNAGHAARARLLRGLGYRRL